MAGKKHILFLMVLLLATAGCRTMFRHSRCEGPNPAQDISWLRERIAEMEKQPGKYKDVEIYRYTYFNRSVFWIKGECCDKSSELLECNGQKICEPDGGLTGKGNGQCIDFFDKRQEETLIWPITNTKTKK